MDLQQLTDRFRQRDRHALARLLTLTARGEHLDTIRALLAESRMPKAESRPSRTIAITGSAGVGKSTLVGRLIEVLRMRNHSVAVLACDPQSPLTGGALLGDRFRMPTRPDDPDVFIRSLATPGEQGAVAEHIDLMVRLLHSFGFQWVILETVGAGQGDTAVRAAAELVVLLLQPEAGDDIQWEKAGVLEIADVVVIHKADLPGADRVEAQVRSLLNLPGCREMPVVRVSSQRQEGLQELVALLEALPPRSNPATDAATELRRRIIELVEDLFARFPDRTLELAERWRAGQLTDSAAAAAVMRLLDQDQAS